MQADAYVETTSSGVWRFDSCIMDTETEPSFEDQWNAARNQLRSYCRRIGGDSNRGDEILQRTALRMWRGYDRLRLKSSFLSWGYRIASREADRLFAQEMAESSRRTDMPPDDQLAVAGGQATAGSISDPRLGLRAALQSAAQQGLLSKLEYSVLRARLDSAHETWHTVGAALGLAPATCAAIHCRSKPKLRVYLFTHFPEILGGMAVIQNAFQRAAADQRDPLSLQERTAFFEVVLNRKYSYRRRGWKESLRSACLKVGRQLAWERNDCEYPRAKSLSKFFP
jgi:DNA-directed RNA polymerase specialized sigma24 family protein